MKKLIVLILLCITPYCFSETTILHHQIGDQSFFSKEIEIKKDKQFNITKLTPIATENMNCLSDYSTTTWTLKNNETSANILVERKNNSLIINGKIRNETFLNKKEQIDNSPWYQSMNRAAQQFLNANKNSQSFWFFSSYSLKLHKMEFTDKELVQININNKLQNAYKIRVTFPGWKGRFWSSYFWFDESKKEFIRYEGRQGPPGAKLTVITKTNKKPS